MNIYPIIQPRVHEQTETVWERTASFRLVVPRSLRFSDKPNLKSKFKLADEEIDKVLNIWILLIHKEYISTCTE